MSLPTFDPGFSTDDLTAVFSAESTVAAMMEFEAALALALADAGVAPRDQAERVAEACRSGVSDPDTILASTWEKGTPIIALRERITATVGAEAGRWFHFGATTQDTVDTAHMIQARTAIGLIEQSLEASARRLRDLTVDYRDQPQLGRTFLQDATPTTFGFRTATWLDAVLGHIVDLRRMSEGLVFQLGGPVGRLDDYGEAASEVLTAMSQRLALSIPDISWHSNRSRVRDLAQTVGRLSATMAKIGSDVALLASSGLGEVTVRSGGSSSMPGKKNPIDTIRAIAASKVCSGAVAMLSGGGHELDRGVGGWHVEWVAWPLVMQSAGAGVEAIAVCLDSLEPDTETMNQRSTTAPREGRQIDTVLAGFDRIVGG